MSLLSWLFPSPKKKGGKVLPDSSGLSRMDPTRPVGRAAAPSPAATGGNAQPANRKGERMARRELLYTVVRDAMMRAGVLSASYKFKVLSLDARGRQFLVMVDLARDFGGETGRLAEIEAMIAQNAKSRHNIMVTAVYWRTNEHVAVGDPNSSVNRARAAAGAPRDLPLPMPSGPMPLDSVPGVLDSSPAPLVMPRAMQAQPVPVPAPARYEPLMADEVAAFKAALAAAALRPVEPLPSVAAQAAVAAAAASAAAVEGAGAQAAHGASARAFDGSAKHGPQSYTLLTGFEDTEMPESDGRQPVLSGTQYGELR